MRARLVGSGVNRSQGKVKIGIQEQEFSSWPGFFCVSRLPEPKSTTSAHEWGLVSSR